MFNQPKIRNNTTGFTLIELVVVIIIIGILAATALPKFINIKQDSQISVVKTTGGSFATGINLAQMKMLSTGHAGPASNIQIYGNGADGQLDFNQWGWPAQNWYLVEESPRLDNTEDCTSVWNTILEKGPTVSLYSDIALSDFQVTYIAPDQCRYFYNPLPTLSIYYDSRDGSVVTDSDPS